MKLKTPETAPELLQTLVRIPSVNMFITGKPFAENNLADFLKKCSLAWGLGAKLLPVRGVGNNLLITKKFKKGAPWIMFCAHMDTVSAEGMDFNPFCGIVKNRRILGRGSCDDKGCITASLWALKELKDSPNNIAILCTVDEEQRRHGATDFCKEQYHSLGFKPAGVIIAEPTSLKPLVAHAGICHFSVIVKGKAAHASDPSKGRSAIKDMIKVIQALETGYIAGLKAKDRLCGRARCSINMIQGGRQVNAIPDECVIRVDRRVMPGEDMNSIIPAVEKVLDKLRAKDRSLRVKVLHAFRDNPLSQKENSDFIKWTLEGLKLAGHNSPPGGAAFATDAGAIGSLGLSCVVLGPGEDALAHTARESMAIKDLDEGVRVFKTIMKNDYYRGIL
jgi:acetylornithine deacetylase